MRLNMFCYDGANEEHSWKMGPRFLSQRRSKQQKKQVFLENKNFHIAQTDYVTSWSLTPVTNMAQGNYVCSTNQLVFSIRNTPIASTRILYWKSVKWGHLLRFIISTTNCGLYWKGERELHFLGQRMQFIVTTSKSRFLTDARCECVNSTFLFITLLLASKNRL